jgi:hypothetical protein
MKREPKFTAEWWRRHRARTKREAKKDRYPFGLLNVLCLFSGPRKGGRSDRGIPRRP